MQLNATPSVSRLFTLICLPVFVASLAIASAAPAWAQADGNGDSPSQASVTEQVEDAAAEAEQTAEQLANDADAALQEASEQVGDSGEGALAQDGNSETSDTETAEEVSGGFNPIEWLTNLVFAVLFFDVFFGLLGVDVPFVVALLGVGAVFFTFFHGFINLRGMPHAIAIVRGKYADPNDTGDVTPFKALTSALSATVGLGNIAGVAIAVKTGGPGAVFWMMVLGFFGMSSKFHESTLAQMFRTKNPDGTVSGGAMYYLSRGMAERGPGMAVLGKVLAVIFAVFCIGGSLGGGNMFQANQSFEGFFDTFIYQKEETIAEQNRSQINPELLREDLTVNQLRASMTTEERKQMAGMDNAEADAFREAARQSMDAETIREIALPSQIETLLPEDEVKAAKQKRDALRTKVSWGYGLILATFVAIVIVGGISRIGTATGAIVPAMCVIYVLGCCTIIALHLDYLPTVVGLIFSNAFATESLWGGFLGAMIIGFTRGAFSSEAGLGSSAIAHSAAKQKEPVREGLVACIEPFVDTIVICFMTAMAVLITDAHLAPSLAEESNGAAVTLFAFSEVGVLSGWFPAVLTISIMLFAFSTMISWCYYGERAWMYLFGHKSLLIYRIIFVCCIVVGATQSLGVVIDFSDAMLLSMALPNVVGGIILAPKVSKMLKDYWRRHKNGEMVTYGTKVTDDYEI